MALPRSAGRYFDQKLAIAVSARILTGAAPTGPAAWTGTLDRTTHATYTAATISVGYVQAEVQAIANAAQNNSRVLAALIDDLRTRGVIA